MNRSMFPSLKIGRSESLQRTSSMQTLPPSSVISPAAVTLQQDLANTIIGTNHESSEAVHAYHLRRDILYSQFWVPPGSNCEAPARLGSAPAIGHDLSTAR